MTWTYNRNIFQIAASIAAGFAISIATAAYSENLTLPDHDPEATLNGKTALEHAQELDRSHPMYRLDALQALAKMETDALPARDAVRALAEQPRDPEVDDRDADQLRIGALSVLVSMQAPEGLELVREKILDPDYFVRDEPYAVLLSEAGRIGIADEVLQEELLALLDKAPDHATRLMALDALADPTQLVLEEAVYHSDHGTLASEHFLTNLSGLAFLDDTAKVAYVVDHRQIAERHTRKVLDALAEIGTEPALDLATELGSQ